MQHAGTLCVAGGSIDERLVHALGVFPQGPDVVTAASAHQPPNQQRHLHYLHGTGAAAESQRTLATTNSTACIASHDTIAVAARIYRVPPTAMRWHISYITTYIIRDRLIRL